MRRFSAISCLFLLLFSLFGRTLWFELRLAETRQEMRSMLEKGVELPGVQSFSLSESEAKGLQWADGGDEFEHAGTRYDVVARKQQGDRLIIHAIPDHKETELLTGYRKSAPDGKEHGAAQLLLKLISLPFISTDAPQAFVPDVPALTHYTVFLQHPQTRPRSILKPPPQQAALLFS